MRPEPIGSLRQEMPFGPWKLNRRFSVFDIRKLFAQLLRKEVIQPHLPIRLPCYDFTPVTIHSLGPCLSCELAQVLLEQTTPMV